jgi:hygromycin-B 7''-O-kinase
LLSDLENLEGYRRLFTDLALWRPYAQEVCRRNHFSPSEAVRGTLPGTCPTFIVDERWVVKFFGRLFEGERAFAVEREANRLAAQLAGPGPAADSRIAWARLLASGTLGGEDDWPWPYLIFEYVPGVSIGTVRDQLSAADRQQTARALGSSLRRLHAIPLEGSPVFANSHQPFLRFLQEQRAGLAERLRAWGSLPARLIEQVDGFLPALEELIEWDRPPHLIHADLTGDHLLGSWDAGGRIAGGRDAGGGNAGRWTSLALIDFGDAMTGSLYYELTALHLDMFAGERSMLAAFLEGYGLSAAQRASLPRRALAAALLHRFDAFAGQGAALASASSLDQLAQALWQV